MDSDTMRRPGSHRRVLDAFRKGEIHILLGTQMIAKGLDFPNVTLVGVVNADVGLHRRRLPRRRTDLSVAWRRSRAGRAGGRAAAKCSCRRSARRHPSIAWAAAHDYLSFAAAEMATRSQHKYPPYQRLARLVIRGKNQEAASRFADLLAAAFGPALESAQRANAEVGEIAHSRPGGSAGLSPQRLLPLPFSTAIAEFGVFASGLAGGGADGSLAARRGFDDRY